MVTKILAGLALGAFATSAFADPPAAAPDLKEAHVTLPYGELKALWQAAQRETPEKRKPPIESALLAARYQVVLKGDQAAGVVDYETESFTDEWTVIPLLGVQTHIDEIEPADIQLIVQDGHYALVTNRPGKQKLRVKFATKLNATTDGTHFRLITSPGAVNTLSVSGLPEKQALRIADATQLSAEKDRASFRLPARDQLDFEVVAEKAVVPVAPSHWKVDVQALVQFADGKLNYAARLAANADNGSGLTMDLELAPNAEITRICGAEQSDWQGSTGERQTRRVHVRWLTRDVLRRELELEYNLPQSLSAADWSLNAP